MTRIASFLADLKSRPQVMGILNLTPDSFSDGGQFNQVDAAVIQAEEMADAGAAVIDIGAESTRPGAEAVDAAAEWQRLEPVLGRLRAGGFECPLSIDSYKAEIVAKAIEAGACLVNDVWGLQRDADMAPLVAAKGLPVVVMHNRDRADETIDIVRDVETFFAKSLAIAATAGILPENIILDPGIGFGKTYAQNFTLLHQLERFAVFGRPLLIGLSRKRFIGTLLDRETDQRLNGTIAANLFARERGAALFRVHEVGPHVEALTMFHALQQGHP